ncbi:MAG: glycosyltransferase [Acidobacteriota bacterium]|nr:glycosyltransferase [Acidobacteriota bacterium]
MLIEAWARVKPHNWHLRIAGPDEAGHRKQLEKAVRSAGLGEVVSFTGALDDSMKRSAFCDAELFVLPTHSESFGIVVAEALAHGVPVLTTKGAPWPALVEKGCGWWVEPTVEGLTKGLREATLSNSEILGKMGKNGRAFTVAELSWKRISNLMLSTYKAILTGDRF